VTPLYRAALASSSRPRDLGCWAALERSDATASAARAAVPAPPSRPSSAPARRERVRAYAARAVSDAPARRRRSADARGQRASHPVQLARHPRRDAELELALGAPAALPPRLAGSSVAADAPKKTLAIRTCASGGTRR